MVLLSYGIPGSPDGWAINDFELFADGDVTNLNQHVRTNGDVRWLETSVEQR